MQAAGIARSRGIPIYTIGAGKDGIVPFPVFDDQGKKIGYRRIMADLDEDALRAIAETTGGRFFRVAESGTIESAFRAIDQSQKIEFQAKSYLITTELFSWLAGPGLALLAPGGAARQRGQVAYVLRGGQHFTGPDPFHDIMTFAWPELLWLLLLPAAWAVAELARRQRTGAEAHPKILRAEAGARAIDLSPAGAGPARRVPAARAGGSSPASPWASWPWPGRSGAGSTSRSSSSRAKS